MTVHPQSTAHGVEPAVRLPAGQGSNDRKTVDD
jgi:hypothetical protein